MKPLRKIAAASAAAATLLVTQAGTASAFDHHSASAYSTTSVRSATAKYHSLAVAEKGGYSILADSAGITCIAEPGMGAMGVHYVNGDRVKNPMIGSAHPEALVYAPDRHGKLHLAALEYVVIKGDWDADQIRPSGFAQSNESPAPPMLFGHEFNFTGAPNRYGLPPFYSLHVWLWKKNPAGTFAMWNPSVHCGPRPS